MLDLKRLRKDFDFFERSFKKRGQLDMLLSFMKLDEQHRAITADLQSLRFEKNTIAETIKKKIVLQESYEDLMPKANMLKEKEEALSKEYEKIEKEFQHQYALLPNILQDDVPEGSDESFNQEIERFDSSLCLISTPKDHIVLGQALGGINVDQAVAMSGSRFIILKGKIARLERALTQFFLDMNTKEFGYIEMSVPYLVKEQAMFASGQLPKFFEDLFQTTDQKFLIPTGEVPLLNYAAQKIFSEQELPLRLTAVTPCFRSEVGSAGRDVYGMIRMHQFHKVELVSIASPEKSLQEHEYMIESIKKLMRLLDLPHRVVVLSAGDTGLASSKTYDVEVFIPSENRYREISSCSNCLDFQARRAQIKVLQEDGQKVYAHTFNGSALPTGRSLLAIIENYQNADGSITIPSVLRPYMDGQEKIGA